MFRDLDDMQIAEVFYKEEQNKENKNLRDNL